jgi:hypothetical protein
VECGILRTYEACLENTSSLKAMKYGTEVITKRAVVMFHTVPWKLVGKRR